ncbi:class I SAM-dependent methyltransferase [Nocardioides panacihumi]|uniref:class I SAM-dependent methyltransferase n=1 Tax=Nocardioides panacihumi TaxID=400774 RepID=UPI0031DA3FA3
MDEAPSVLRSSFGAAAAAYAEHRPDYAPAAVRWALAAAPGPRVLDLGAGTGKLTQVLVAVGADVTAVEPDAAMLAELRRRLPGVPAMTGRAEEIPLADGTVDAVLAGHSLHWFDMAVAGPEISRVLEPGGTLAGLWNVLDDRVDWVAALARVAGPAVVGPRDLLSSWRAATARAYLPPPGAPAAFDAPRRAEFVHGQRRSVASLVDALATRAGVLVMSPRERETTLSRVRAFLLDRPETVGEFDVPMLTGVLRVTRPARRSWAAD